jgi:hypothetical protein
MGNRRDLAYQTWGGFSIMLTLEVRRRPGTSAELHRITGPSATVGASSGNEIVVRARGVYGRHVRLLQRDGGYHLDLFKGIQTVQVNGRDFFGGAIAPGDRIAIGEATITVVDAGSSSRPAPVAQASNVEPFSAPTSAAAAVAPPTFTEVEYRALRLSAYRLCREGAPAEELATELTDFLDRELPPSEWAVGEFSAATGFRPLASTFRELPALPPRLTQELSTGERLARAEIVTGVLTLVVEPGDQETRRAAILVRETPRLPARAILFLEELAQLAGIALAGCRFDRDADAPPGPAQVDSAPHPAVPGSPPPEPSAAEAVLRQTDDLKKIVETVEREVIDRAMRRVEGNQSRGAQVLNISRGSLIAKLKEFQIPDYRYLRRERSRRS